MRRAFALLAFVVQICAVGTWSDANAQAAMSVDAAARARSEGAPPLFLDASRLPPAWEKRSTDGAGIVLFDPTLRNRQARALAERERGAGRVSVHWLTGSAPQWRQAQLPLPAELVPVGPVPISPADLAGVLRDQIPVALIDVRSKQQFDRGHVQGSTSLLPHELLGATANLPRDRWLVFIDHNGAAVPHLAGQLRAGGFFWVAYLEGGYAAWSDLAASGQ
jgi:rhodanese-related sulfurtransferase